jgi:hypothetical protein
LQGTLELPGGNFAVPEDEKTRLKMIYPKNADGTVTFLGEFEGRDFAYDYVTSSEKSPSRCVKRYTTISAQASLSLASSKSRIPKKSAQ